MAKFICGSTVWVVPEKFWKAKKPIRGTIDEDHIVESSYDELFKLRVKEIKTGSVFRADYENVFHCRRSAVKAMTLLRASRALRIADHVAYDSRKSVRARDVVNRFREMDSQP